MEAATVGALFGSVCRASVRCSGSGRTKIGLAADEVHSAALSLSASSSTEAIVTLFLAIASEKKRADDELRAQPLKVGDRVRHKGWNHSYGTIVRLWSDGADVASDSAYGACWEAMDELEPLIPGDPGYEVPAVKRAEVEKMLAEHRVLLQGQRGPIVGDRVGKLLRHIARPALNSVEGHDPRRIGILSIK